MGMLKRFVISKDTHGDITGQAMNVRAKQQPLIRRDTVRDEIYYHGPEDHQAVDHFEEDQHLQCAPHWLDQLRAKTHYDQIDHH